MEQHSKFLLHTLQVLCMCTLLWFYKHQHDNRVRSTENAFSLPFAAILVNCAPSGEMHNYCTPHYIKENFENFLIHRCNYILLSQVYCVWQVVKTPTIILVTLYKLRNCSCCWHKITRVKILSIVTFYIRWHQLCWKTVASWCSESWSRRNRK